MEIGEGQVAARPQQERAVTFSKLNSLLRPIPVVPALLPDCRQKPGGFCGGDCGGVCKKSGLYLRIASNGQKHA